MSANVIREEKIEISPAMYGAGLLELGRDRSFESDHEFLTRLSQALRAIERHREK
jgi:hypothetical protein